MKLSPGVTNSATLAFFLLIPLLGCQQKTTTVTPRDTGAYAAADFIYTGGTILTMNDAQPTAEALAVRNGLIVAVGPTDAVLAHRGPYTKMRDLKGRTMMPGFYDPHSHISGYALELVSVDLSPPISNVASIADLQAKLKDYIKTNRIRPGQLVFGMDYDSASLKENRQPTRNDLDKVSTENPIVLLHGSGHFLALNSKALELAKITKDTKDPEGGAIERLPDGQPSGVLDEHAMFLAVPLLPKIKGDNPVEVDRLAQGVNAYAKFGITTGQDGLVVGGTWVTLTAAAAADRLPIDVVGLAAYYQADKLLEGYDATNPQYLGRYRNGGVKIVLDGSIQGYTAYLTKPYFVPPPGQDKLAGTACVPVTETPLPAGPKFQPEGYRGHPDMPQAEVNQYFAHFFQMGWDIYAHCNGDAAADMMLEAVAQARQKYPDRHPRITMVHAQMVREDQLDKMKALEIYPSFFPGHTYYWGDKHRDQFLGPERAARMDPAKSALDKGILFTLHTDAPVTPPDMLTAIWCAVNRTTLSGQELGSEQRIPVKEALKAVTINPAWLNREDKNKGTLEPGKEADLVILSDNPLTIDPMKIKDLQVLETIKDGKNVYTAQK